MKEMITNVYMGMPQLIFSLQVRSGDSPVSQFGNLLFWLMVADVLYRAATKETVETAGGAGNDTSGENTSSTGASEGTGRRWGFRRGRGERGGQSAAMVTFEDAIMKRHTPRE